MSTASRQIRDTDLAKVEAALRRAAKKARVIAEKTHTPLVVYEAGQVVKKYPGREKNK